jgi:regulator of protease activity HflC (stomatin/prohibitin superfamily)
MEYITLIQPALLAATIIATVVLAARGFSRGEAETILVADEEITKRPLTFSKRSGLRATATFVGGLLVTMALVVTPPGHRGIVYSAVGGVSDNERTPGYSLVVPLLQSAIMMNVQTQKYFTDEAFAQSADLQEITVVIAVDYHLEPTKASDVYDDIGKEYEDKVIRPAVFQLAKQEVGLVLAEDFALQREQIATSIFNQLVPMLASYGIVVEFVAIEDAIFQPAFIAAVQAKVVAEQRAQEQINLVPEAKARADQAVKIAQGQRDATILVAEGEAKAIEEVSSALGFTPDEYLTYLFEQQWDGVFPSTFVGSSDLGILLGIGDE